MVTMEHHPSVELSNVMEQLGYKFSNDNGKLKKGSGRSEYLFFACTIISSGIKNSWAYPKESCHAHIL